MTRILYSPCLTNNQLTRPLFQGFPLFSFFFSVFLVALQCNEPVEGYVDQVREIYKIVLSSPR